jgi:UDP-GlcNAc:undecaprenyl-phosphate/decaprenyl-phosphate GlcNAc-1-phosphate transferase
VTSLLRAAITRGGVVALAAGAAQAAYTLLTGNTAAARRWDRTNHRGERVTLLEGPAFTAATAVTLAVAPGIPGRLRAAGVVAAMGCGALGAYDDLAGSGDARGIKGHLRALLHGEVTTGAVKVLGIGATGLVAAALAGRPPAANPQRSWANGHDTPVRRSPKPMIVSKVGGAAGDVLLGGAVVAGLANLVNLFDLRPGRAIKVGVALGAPAIAQPGPAGVVAAAPVGAALALLPEDLGERAMLGDAGANALGAVIGVAVLARYDRRGRLAHLVAATALTLASEKVSFTRVIERTSVLRRLDALGRRQVTPPKELPE